MQGYKCMIQSEQDLARILFVSDKLKERHQFSPPPLYPHLPICFLLSPSTMTMDGVNSLQHFPSSVFKSQKMLKFYTGECQSTTGSWDFQPVGSISGFWVPRISTKKQAQLIPKKKTPPWQFLSLTSQSLTHESPKLSWRNWLSVHLVLTIWYLEEFCGCITRAGDWGKSPSLV